jgi:serine/threonine-protein kinase
LSARPEQAPVLVLAKNVRLPAAAAPAPARTRGAADMAMWASALLMALAAAGLLVWKTATPPAAEDGAPALPRTNTEEYDLTVSGRLRAKAPPPPALAAPPVPQAHPRHPTAPDGTPVASDGSAGQRFGRYQLLNRIGEGGMAEVFTAVATGVEGFSRVFVLKRLRPALSHNQEAVAQFIDEARLQASLVHSNIVPVFDFGRVADEYFMTQEYIVGRDLSRVVAGHYESRQDALGARLAHYIAFETLLALQYAHTRHDKDGQPLGIVHRDVSPGNVILSAEGEVKLADFGIVKSNKRVTQTQVGMVKGNANFMSPEQARGHHIDARSDVFSVGLVLLYCLTNHLPYEGENDLEVLFKAASGPTAALQQEIDALPSPAREALGRALALDPADRFQSAAEFADILAPHIAGAKAEAAQLMKGLFGEALLREAA